MARKTRKTATASRPSKPVKTSATRKIPIQRVTSERVSEPVPPSVPAGSLARRKHALLDELRSSDVSAERQIEIRAELDESPMTETPILSWAELQRLGQ